MEIELQFRYNPTGSYEPQNFTLDINPQNNFDSVISQVAEFLEIEKYNICLRCDSEILWHDIIVRDSGVTIESIIDVSLNQDNLINWSDVFTWDDDDGDHVDRSFPEAKYYSDYIGNRGDRERYITKRNGKKWSIYLPSDVNNSDWYLYDQRLKWWKNHLRPTDNIILRLTSDDGGRVTFQIDDCICIAGCHGCHPYVETREISFSNSDGSSSFSCWLENRTPEGILEFVNDYLVSPCH